MNMLVEGVPITDKTLRVIKRLQEEELAQMYVDTAEELIDFVMEVEEQTSMLVEKKALEYVKMLRYLSKDMAHFAEVKEGVVQ